MNQVDGGCPSLAECENCGEDRVDPSQRMPAIRGQACWGRGVWPLLSGVLFLAVPKCPLCLAAWLGALGVVGGGAAWHGPLRGALAAALLVALAGFGVSAWRRRDVRPLIVAVLGGITAWVSQSVTEGLVLRSISLVLLLVAAVWNTTLLARIRRSVPHG